MLKMGPRVKERESLFFLSPSSLPCCLHSQMGRCSKSRGSHAAEQNEYVTYLAGFREGMRASKASSRRITHVPSFCFGAQDQVKDIGCNGNLPQDTHTHQHSPLAIVNR